MENHSYLLIFCADVVTVNRVLVFRLDMHARLLVVNILMSTQKVLPPV